MSRSAFMGVVITAVLATSRIAAATCPSDAASIDTPDFAGCFADWDTHNSAQGGLSPAELAKVKSLDWFERVIAAAEQHKSATPASKVDLAALREPMKALSRTLQQEAFDRYACGDERTWCLDRDGAAFGSREVSPELSPSDRLIVVVLSYRDDDRSRVAISSRSITSAPTLLPAVGAAAGGAATPTPFVEVTRLELVVPSDASRVEISVVRTADLNGGDTASRRHTLQITRRRHVVELGLSLPFARDRRVSGSGAVSYGIEPELAFSIAIFPGTRITDQALQPGRSWVGIMLAADVTRALSEKRYYAGVDFAPINGISFNTGFAIMPWAYVPSPEAVDDVLTSDIMPIRRYHVSYFFGIRVTADFFRTTKAAYDGLKGDL